MPCTDSFIRDRDADGNGLQRTQLACSTPLNPAAIPGSDGQPKLTALSEQHQPHRSPLHHRHRRLHEAGRASHSSFPEAWVVDEAHRTSVVPSGGICVPSACWTEQRNTRPQLLPQRSPQAQVLELRRDGSSERASVDKEVRSPMRAHKCDQSPTPSSCLCFDCDATSDGVHHRHGAMETSNPSGGSSGGAKQTTEIQSATGTRCTPKFSGSSYLAQSDTVEATWQPAHRIANSAGSSPAGPGEVQWATHIRHSVTGALDEAMEALEAELGFRSQSQNAHGSGY